MTPQQRHILREVSGRTGISIERIVSRDRNQYVVSARHEVMRRLYAMGCYSLSQIGRVVGKDHSTVAHAVGAVQTKRPSRRGWHRPRIGHLNCPGCRHCVPSRARQAKIPSEETPAAKAPSTSAEPVKRVRHRAARKQYLIPYAGFDPNEYKPRERP